MNKHELAYIKWYIGSNKRNLLVISLLYLVTVTLPAILFPGNTEKYVRMVPLAASMMTLAVMTCILSFVIAIYNYKHLMFKRSCDMYLAMPIKRSHFFYMQYFLGLLALLIIPLLAMILAFICDPMAMKVFPYYAFLIAAILLFCAAQYTIYTFLTLKCNNFWDAIIVCIAYTVLPVFVLLAAYIMLNSALSQTMVGFGATTDEIFNSLYASSFISVPAVLIGYISNMMNGVSEFLQESLSVDMIMTKFIEDGSTSFMFLWYWLLAGIVFFFLARHTFIKRSGEEAEQQTTSKICYPVIIILVTMSLLFGSGIFTGDWHNASFSLLILTIVIYGLMNFFAMRKIKVTKVMVIKFMGMIVTGLALTFVVVSTKGFGQIHELPVFDDIQAVQISVYFADAQKFTIKDPRYEQLDGYEVNNVSIYEQMKTKEWIDRIYALNKDIIDHANEGDYAGNIEITYCMQNGKSLRRGTIFTETYVNQLHILLQNIIDEEKDKNVVNDIMNRIMQDKQRSEEQAKLNEENNL